MEKTETPEEQLERLNHLANTLIAGCGSYISEQRSDDQATVNEALGMATGLITIASKTAAKFFELMTDDEAAA